MLKSRRLTSLLSQSLTPLSPPIDTFTPSTDATPSSDHQSAKESPSTTTTTSSAAALPPAHSPRIVMVVLLTTSGNLLAASTLNSSSAATIAHSLALSPSVSQSTLGAGQNGNGTTAGSIGSATSAIHLADLSPKPRVYASYAANVWRSYTKSLEQDAVFETEDPEVDWIAVENEESTIIIHSVAGSVLLALVGERGSPVGLVYARTTAMASTLREELQGFSFD
ncbi:hypothetical protein BZA70DRAFT_290610 [Myxozyma melibiosi]|uniref:Uncharacterized protein n=1 Tax=Myxozyma melibiosi TaxID=54550 RepID=A0ABR1F2J5_9ASCO